MKRLAIIGSGDLGQLIAHHAINDNHYSVTGYFDDTKTKGEIVEGIEVLGGLNDIEKYHQENIFDVIMVGIGYNHMQFRKKIFIKFQEMIPFGSIIHSSCYIDSSTKIGKGVFLLPGCIVDKDVVIGDNVLLNTGCTIAHDTTINNHCFLSPSVKIAGKTTIGECCVLGINSTIIDNLVIGSYIKTGGGTVVINNIPESGLYVGVPAKFIKKLVQ